MMRDSTLSWFDPNDSSRQWTLFLETPTVRGDMRRLLCLCTWRWGCLDRMFFDSSTCRSHLRILTCQLGDVGPHLGPLPEHVAESVVRDFHQHGLHG
eukprot:CAMPEP_0174939390 /NCGR_PEP_ID=MMETSP1355-20121228/66435_1 /TAXON_ID=464990 /ORGANISM="Hemiselmis tepida, Strain CCMP443" /LENGTH=96 /DNA_ID=CAMNT_0016186403 /DNA_START=152 /DNA_END=439 /DNA_ORIENTATION=+